MSIDRIPNTSGATYSDGVVVGTAEGRWVHVSGQLPVDREGNVIEGNLRQQADECFKGIERVLERCGAGLGDVVRITAYLTSLDRYSDYGEVRGAWFGDSLPASAAVQVSGLLGGAMIEIDAVAFVGPS